MPSEDEMAREVAKRKLMLAAKEKKNKQTKAKVFNQKRTVTKRTFTRKKAGIKK